MKWLDSLLEGCIALFGMFLAAIPHTLFYWHILALARVARLIDRRRYQNAMSNLHFIYGDSLSLKEKQKIIHRGYQNFTFVILESIRLPYLNKERYLARFSFRGKENLFSLLREKKNVMLISAHYGYWEALGTAIPLQMQKEGLNYYDMSSLGKLTDIAFIDKMMRKRREIFGVRLINKKGAFKELLKTYAGSLAGCGILIDQHIDRREGIELDFLGQRATQTTISSVISRRFDVALLVILIDFNQDYSRFELDISEAIYCKKGEDAREDIADCTAQQVKLIEQKILTHPSSWLWFHKRWKAFYPSLYQS